MALNILLHLDCEVYSFLMWNSVYHIMYTQSIDNIESEGIAEVL